MQFACARAMSARACTGARNGARANTRYVGYALMICWVMYIFCWQFYFCNIADPERLLVESATEKFDGRVQIGKDIPVLKLTRYDKYETQP